MATLRILSAGVEYHRRSEFGATGVMPYMQPPCGVTDVATVRRNDGVASGADVGGLECDT
jgi:hypothetical protein